MYEDPNPLVNGRLSKVDEMRELGIEPYPQAAYQPSHTVPEIRDRAEELVSRETQVKIGGRILARRRMGQVVFFDLLDDGAKLQAYCRRPNLGEETWHVLEFLDLGDFIGLAGPIFHTRSGELSIRVETLTVLGKASHPIPLPKQRGEVVFDAITDKGLRYRHRHIDVIAHPETRATLVTRTRIIRGNRQYLDEEGFLEVETPILGQTYSGAAARPFVTDLHALDQRMFLRISPECALKRLLCAGFNRVYELGKNFRNEGIDASHNPELTMVEWYEAYSDYFHQMIRFETLVASLCEEIHGTTKISYRGRRLDLTPPWGRVPMLDGLRELVGIDMHAATITDIPEIFHAHHPEGTAALPEPLSWGASVVELFETLIEPHLWQPVFVMDHPAEVSPLTKRHRLNPRLAERFEPFVGGIEIGSSYSELNDPVEQYERLTSQQVAREAAYDVCRRLFEKAVFWL